MSSTDFPFLIVGLGNPGEEYRSTRHNIGFEVIDALATRWKASSSQKKFHGLLGTASFKDQKVLLLKPQTFMNLSGKSIGEAIHFYKSPAESHLLVISDDLDLPPGRLRLKPSGGAGGHNGLKSAISVLGSETFPRLRMGIGRHPHMPSDEFVLSRWTKAEKPVVEQMVANAVQSIEILLSEGIARAMESANRKESTP